MTRFARAKGSKSSNERKPEEATSWSEMRNSMLSKQSNQKEEKPIPSFEPVKVETPNKTEWASLGDTLSESISLIKQHMSKKSNSAETVKKEGKKKKKSVENELNETVSGAPKSVKKLKKKNNESVLNQSASDSAESEKKKIKKPKDADSEPKVKKKGNKRKLIEGDPDSETLLPKKKKKVQKSENSGSEKSEKKADNRGNKNRQMHQNVKKGMKSKNFRKENEVNRGFRSKKGKQFEGGNKFKNKHYQERNSGAEELIINGEKIPIIKFQGFYVTLEDAERLKKLRSEMMKEGIPKAKLEAAIKLERRRAEKALSRLKKSVCFHCRGHGHLLSNCPNLLEKENTGTGICYKCGSTEHSAAECKVVRGTNYQFAECFICKEQGHIARQCPDNPRGLYPQGGACRECGDVTHLRKDCPKVQAQKADEVVTVGVRRDRDLECLDEEIDSRDRQNSKNKVKRSSTVKF